MEEVKTWVIYTDWEPSPFETMAFTMSAIHFISCGGF